MITPIFPAASADAALMHPSTTKDDWWEIAIQHPLAALQCPLFDLMTLEEPGRWSQALTDNGVRWINLAAHRLHFRRGDRFACECLLHYQWLLFQNEEARRIFGEDAMSTLKQLIDLRHRYAHGLILLAQWKNAASPVEAMLQSSSIESIRSAFRYVHCLTAKARIVPGGILNAIYLHGRAHRYDANHLPIDQTEPNAAAWMWTRLIEQLLPAKKRER